MQLTNLRILYNSMTKLRNLKSEPNLDSYYEQMVIFPFDNLSEAFPGTKTTVHIEYDLNWIKQKLLSIKWEGSIYYTGWDAANETSPCE